MEVMSDTAEFVAELQRNAPQDVFEIIRGEDGLVLLRKDEVGVLQYEKAACQFSDAMAPVLAVNGFLRPSMLGKDRDAQGNFVWRLVRD